MNHSLTQMPVLRKQVIDQRAFHSDPKKQERETARQLTLAVFFDLLILNFALLGFLLLQVPFSQLAGQGMTQEFYFLLLLFNLIWLIYIPFTDIYRVFEGARLDLKIRDLFWNTLIYFGLITLIYYQFFFQTFQVHFLMQSFSAFMVLSTISHYIFRYYNRNKVIDLTYAVVGGGNTNLKYLDKGLSSIYGDDNAVCIGRFAQENLPDVPSLGTYDDIEAYLQENHYRIKKLFYFYSDLPKQMVQRIIQLCRNQYIDFEIVPIGVDFFERGVHVEQLAHLPIVRRKKEPLCIPHNKLLKRWFDILFSITVLLLILPFFPIIALLIRLESKGPVFFIQKRTGYWNKPFGCIKFRTMAVNEQSDQQQAVKNDARVTKIGAFLRKTNIDEFPQFINVLLGDMSVIGPRPHMIKHTEVYSSLIDKYMIRHEVKPGISGWAQVNGWRGPTEELYQMGKRVEFDVDYIENWSFWFDCKCIFLTVFNMLKGEKNAF